ncbi:hypothetical protein [Xanthomonas graminis]|nr:hypothetical protein [Xanthomonas translucens]
MFGWLFTQYRTPGKLHFGSKWLNLHGRMFIGNPENFGLQDCRNNVLTSYYYLRADRKMPVSDDGEFDAWRMDALRASQVRHASEKHVSKAGFLVTSAACVALCFGAMVINKAKATLPSSSAGQAASALSLEKCIEKEAMKTLGGKELQDCIALAKKMNKGGR